MHKNHGIRLAALIGGITIALLATPLRAAAGERDDDDRDRGKAPRVQWVDHFDLLSGDPQAVTTSSTSTNSGVGTGLTGLVVTSPVTGDTDSFGGNKVVHMALELQPGTRIRGVRLCYELSGSSYIEQIRLAQIQNPPATALVLLDDATPQLDPGPVCVNSTILSKPIQSQKGSVLLSFRFNTVVTSDKIVIRAVGLLVD